VQFGAVIARVGVGADLAGVVALAQRVPDELVEAERPGAPCCPSSLLRVVQHRGAALGLLPGFLPAQGGELQQCVEARGVLVAPPIG
jgi:hypothetical protein